MDKLRMQNDTPETRQNSASNLVNFLERSGMIEYFSDPARKEKFIREELTAQMAEEFLERLNGIIVGTPIDQRGIFTHAGRVVNPRGEMVYQSPFAHIQKAFFEEDLLPAFKLLSSEDMPKVAASMINLFHTFRDGNGRLGRLIYLLLQPNINLRSDSVLEKINQSLSQRVHSINWNPGLIETELSELMEKRISREDETVANVNAASIITHEQVSRYGEGGKIVESIIRNDTNDAILGLRQYLMKIKGKRAKEFLLPRRKEGEFMFNMKKILEEMKTKEDWGELYDFFNIPKLNRIGIMMDIFIHPDDYSSPVEGKNLKEYYEDKVLNNS